MADDQRDLIIKVGEYNINYSAEIGSGSFGTAYEASKCGSDDKYVAKMIKLKKQGSLRISLVTKAANEIKALSKANHENIVNTYYFSNEIRGYACIIMEFCELGDMQQYLNVTKNLDLLSKMKLKQQCANGLAFIHDSHIIHRDLKLGNILIAQINGTAIAKIADFGYCKLLVDSTLNEIMTTRNAGTKFYRAPEMFSQRRVPYCKSLDIFSLGLVFMVLFEYDLPNRYTVPVSGNNRNNKHKVLTKMSQVDFS